MGHDSGLGSEIGRWLPPRRVRAAKNAPGPDGQGANLTVALSLNLILLAFFVVLASAASFDAARVESAVVSIRENFGEIIQEARGDLGGSRTQAEASLREAVASAFAAVLPGYEITVPAAADRIDVVVPAAALFEDAFFELRPTLPVLDRLVTLLSAPPAGFRFEVILGATAGGDNPAIVVSRADAVGRELVRRGLGQDLISAGSAMATGGSVPAIVFTFLVVDAEDDMPLHRHVSAARPS